MTTYKNNRYFEVVEPFRIYRHVGLSPSNSYVGRSQSITIVMEAENAKPGDMVHALCGGNFLVRDGETHAISFNIPKPLFERSYGGGMSVHEVLLKRASLGQLKEFDEPPVKCDFQAARAKVEANRLKDYHSGLIVREPSPEFVRLRTLAELYADTVGEPVTTRLRDFDCDNSPSLKLTHRDFTLDIRCGLGLLSVTVPVGTYQGSIEEARNYGGESKQVFRFANIHDAKADTLVEHIALGQTAYVERPPQP